MTRQQAAWLHQNPDVDSTELYPLGTVLTDGRMNVHHFLNVCIEILLVAPLASIFGLIASWWAPIKEGQEK